MTVLEANCIRTQMKRERTVLGEDINFKGKLYLKDSLTINGYFRGYIQTPEELLIGSAGKVEADIDAGDVCVEGRVQGNVFASKSLRIRKNAQILGDIRTGNLQVESGSRFRGACIMD